LIWKKELLSSTRNLCAEQKNREKFELRIKISPQNKTKPRLAMDSELARQLPNNVIMKIIREATTLKWRDNFSEVVAQISPQTRWTISERLRPRDWMDDPHHPRYWKSPFQKNTFFDVVRDIVFVARSNNLRL
jgi:hypothetical protein